MLSSVKGRAEDEVVAKEEKRVGEGIAVPTQTEEVI
jgi:hypothetical protein